MEKNTGKGGEFCQSGKVGTMLPAQPWSPKIFSQFSRTCQNYDSIVPWKVFKKWILIEAFNSRVKKRNGRDRYKKWNENNCQHQEKWPCRRPMSILLGKKKEILSNNSAQWINLLCGAFSSTRRWVKTSLELNFHFFSVVKYWLHKCVLWHQIEVFTKDCCCRYSVNKALDLFKVLTSYVCICKNISDFVTYIQDQEKENSLSVGPQTYVLRGSTEEPLEEM